MAAPPSIGTSSILQRLGAAGTAPGRVLRNVGGAVGAATSTLKRKGLGNTLVFGVAGGLLAAGSFISLVVSAIGIHEYNKLKQAGKVKGQIGSELTFEEIYATQLVTALLFLLAGVMLVLKALYERPTPASA